VRCCAVFFRSHCLHTTGEQMHVFVWFASVPHLNILETDNFDKVLYKYTFTLLTLFIRELLSALKNCWLSVKRACGFWNFNHSWRLSFSWPSKTKYFWKRRQIKWNVRVYRSNHLGDKYSWFCDAKRMARLTTPTNDAHSQRSTSLRHSHPLHTSSLTD